MRRVVIADPCDMYRGAVGQMIRRSDGDVEVAGELRTTAEAISRTDWMDVDAFIVCVHGDGGLEAIQELRHRAEDSRIIVFSFADDGDSIVAALRAGADGFVPKWTAAKDLMGVLAAVLDGRLGVHPALVGVGLESAVRPSSAIGDMHELSPRERTVLELMSQGLCNREIAKELFLSTRTVEGHLANVYKKLGVNGRMQAARMFERWRQVS